MGVNKRRDQAAQVQNSYEGPTSTVENIVKKGGGAVFGEGITNVRTAMET